MDQEAAAEVIATVADAGITVVSTPLVDEFTQVALLLDTSSFRILPDSSYTASRFSKACHPSACSQGQNPEWRFRSSTSFKASESL